METISLSAQQAGGSSQHAFGTPHTFSMAGSGSFIPALVRHVILQVGHQGSPRNSDTCLHHIGENARSGIPPGHKLAAKKP